MSTALEAGAVNCVIDCAGVRRGTKFYVVSERGAVDEAVVSAIVAAGLDANADVREVWGGKIPKDKPNDIPTNVLEAYRNGEVIVSHYPSLKREALFEHFGNETRVRVPNRARTIALLSSDWGRFPYTLQRALAAALDTSMKPGAKWTLTSPSGTDLRGTFAAAGSEVGAAFFVDTDEGRARRNFPGGVHSPHNSIDVSGVIVCDYIDNVEMSAENEPLRVEVKDGRIVAMTGGDPAGAARKLVESTDGWIDSWHAGVNPRTEVPVARRENGREWFSYTHCSPDINHLHLGRTHDTTNIACFNHTLKIDGSTYYRDGELAYLDTPALAKLPQLRAVSEDMLHNKAFDPW